MRIVLRAAAVIVPLPIIPLFVGNPSHPFVPLGRRPAGARSEGQGRPTAGASRAPFTAASTLAGWRRSGVGSALGLAILLLVGGAPAVALAQEPPTERAAARHPYAGHVAEAARRFGIPEAWIWAVMRVESNGDVRAVSPAGATGLMQIMPATWAALRSRYGLGADPFDPRDNIMAGTAYLREMHDRYGDARAMLAAYNAGPGRYDEHLTRGRPLPRETVAYLAMLAPVAGGSSDAQVAATPPPDPLAWRRAALFVRLASVADTAPILQADDDTAAAEMPAEAPPDPASNVTTIVVPPSPARPVDTLFVRRAGEARPQ